MAKDKVPLSEREYARERTDRIIAERFSSSSMSDAKWVRLLNALTEMPEPIDFCRLKLVWDDEVRRLAIRGCSYEFDYWPHAVEGMITGAPRGWYDYKEIEWLEFRGSHSQLCQLGQELERVGQFDLQFVDDQLRLYAYR